PRRDRRHPQPAKLHDRRAAWHAHPPSARRPRDRAERGATHPPLLSDTGCSQRRRMRVDLAIVGAGPAGMAAAALAAELGLDTMLIDEQDGPGGQIYRGIERLPGEADRRSSLGRDSP